MESDVMRWLNETSNLLKEKKIFPQLIGLP